MKCCIYERSRLQAVESAIRDDISFEMDARLYEIVVECITSDLHYDIPEFAVVEPYGVVDPLRVSHGLVGLLGDSVGRCELSMAEGASS